VYEIGIDRERLDKTRRDMIISDRFKTVWPKNIVKRVLLSTDVYNLCIGKL